MKRNSFSVVEETAKQLENEDHLSEFRDKFYIPKNTIYMNGNSLGLLSKEGEKTLLRTLNEWKTEGVKGWVNIEQPWFFFAEKLGEKASSLVGAKPSEVIATGTTTINIHSLISTFYKPEGKRTKILADELNFPTDIYALQSQVKLKGLDPKEHLILVRSEDGRILEEETIVKAMTDEIAIILLPSAIFRSGQLLDVKYITEEARKRGILIGWDCSHSVGVIPHHFDDWGVDFAVWCSYKYLNAGPGASAFLYVSEKHFDKETALSGWFGYVKEKQFEMNLHFEQAKSAGGWQISSPSILGSAALDGALDVILDAGIDNIREKSLKMTSYMIYLVDELLSEEPYNFSIGTPREKERRGGHIALEHQEAYKVHEELLKKNVIHDFRPPNIIRLTPSPLYNTYSEIWKVISIIKSLFD
jgi:kynureninase